MPQLAIAASRRLSVGENPPCAVFGSGSSTRIAGTTISDSRIAMTTPTEE